MVLNGLKIDNFEIKVTEQLGQIRIQWLGRSEARNPGDILNPYLNDMVEHLKGKHIIIDYTKLEYMNSSTVPPIIKFIKSCSLNEIITTVQYSKNSEWQSASFRPLQTVCMSLKNVVVQGI